MGKNAIKLNEAQLKSLISEAVKNAMYDFASDKPQYDINSDEWNSNYDEMERAARGKDKDWDNAMMDLQTRHHFGEKGKGDFEGELPKQKKQFKKDKAMSQDTIESQVMSELNGGKSPDEIMNLTPFSEEEAEYIKDDCLGWLDPVGTIDKAGKIVFYDAKKDRFVSYEDDREY